jgi:HK97 gp10 family phage protein
MKIKIEGLRDLEKALQELGDDRARRAVANRALKKAAQPIAESARSKVPVLFGDLRDSITVAKTTSQGDVGKQAFARVVRQTGDKALASQALRDARRGAASIQRIYIGPGRNPQAIFQEFGTINHPPQAFMRPAWDELAEPTLARIQEELAADIQKTAARIAKKKAAG